MVTLIEPCCGWCLEERAVVLGLNRLFPPKRTQDMVDIIAEDVHRTGADPLYRQTREMWQDATPAGWENMIRYLEDGR